MRKFFSILGLSVIVGFPFAVFGAIDTVQDFGGGPATFSAIECDGTNTLEFDTDTLVVDCANNRVGVGTASPATTLHIIPDGTEGAIRAGDVGPPTGGSNFTYGIVVSSPIMAVNSSGAPGVLSMYNPLAASNEKVSNITNRSGGFNFELPQDDATASDIDALVIERSGAGSAGVGINQASPSAALDIVGSADDQALEVNTPNGKCIVYEETDLADAGTIAMETPMGSQGFVWVVTNGNVTGSCQWLIFGGNNSVTQTVDGGGCATTSTASKISMESDGDGTYTFRNRFGNTRDFIFYYCGI